MRIEKEYGGSQRMGIKLFYLWLLCRLFFPPDTKGELHERNRRKEKSCRKSTRKADGASTLFLYTKGTEDVPDEALGQLLHYMEETTYENAVNEALREMHEMVETVKKDPEVTVRYMIGYLKEMERLNKASAKAREEGLAAGLAE